MELKLGKAHKYNKNDVTLKVTCEVTTMNITQFAETHNQNPKNITMYISRHRELFEGHVKTVGKNKYLDNEAIRLLEIKYPLKETINCLKDVETQKKYIEALEEINLLNKSIIRLQGQIQESKSLKSQVEQSNELIKKLTDELVQSKLESQLYREKCEFLRKRTFFDFLFRRRREHEKTPNEII